MADFKTVYETIERDGFTLAAEIVPDDSNPAPWKEEDGHGPVSDWRRANYTGRFDKAPGERMLCRDGDSAMFYDFAAAVRMARAEGWDAPPYDEGTPGQRAVRAAEADFGRMQDWCNDQWCYVGVVVTASRNDVELGSASLWGIESDAGEYLVIIANELADEAIEEARAKLATLCQCEQDRTR